ncbi:hypothetical protein [Rahnella ecdela]|uniref:Uncharacterized protein n=1 Tax=Rahnella ecdela TaxID=2816250 RepID=A0ABS6LAJ8_9GAMM|nr:hypothetical protein [Rahnella ecdela]MBU9843970.1 hypothetical protein [Rahnella ecdela]
MKINAFAILLASLCVLPAIADEPASSKPLPKLENGYAGLLCGYFDGKPPSPELVSQAVARIKLMTKRDKAYIPFSANRVAKAYAYRDRDHGGDCWANVQDEYWKPKNQPK